MSVTLLLCRAQFSHEPSCRGLGGIVTGDVIVGIDGQPVKRGNDLSNVLDAYKIGDRVTLRVLREVTRLSALAICGELQSVNE